jgi:hypothetical protein
MVWIPYFGAFLQRPVALKWGDQAVSRRTMGADGLENPCGLRMSAWGAPELAQKVHQTSAAYSFQANDFFNQPS